MQRTHSSKIVFCLLWSALLLATLGAPAATVGVNGYTNDFSVQPAAADFATANIGGGSGDATDAATLDAAVAALTAAGINTQLPSAAGSPPAAAATSVFNDTDKNLQLRPTGVKLHVIMATLVNNAGGNASAVNISYNLLQTAIAGEQVDGVRVYYSLTGAANSWSNVAGLNATTAGLVSANVVLATTWTNGSPLYLLFVDDNGSPSPDTANQIDNFFIGIGAFTAELPVAITTQPQNVTVTENQSANFTVGTSGHQPITFQWYRGVSPIANATNASYTLTNAQVPDSGALFKVVAANVASNISYTVTSAVATLTVLGDTNRPFMTLAIPTTNTTVTSLNHIEVRFSKAVTNVDAADLLINNVPGTNIINFAPDVYVIYFAQPATGTVQVAWAPGHGIVDLASTPNTFVGGSWTYTLDPSANVENLQITEFLASNQHGIRDEDGDRNDWVEIYNAGLTPVNLNGWSLTDDPANLNKWRFPGLTLTSHAYMYLFASNKNRTNITSRLHTNFKIAKGGGSLVLSRPDGSISSQFLAYPAQTDDVSYGRDLINPNLVGFYSVTTPGAPNQSIGAGIAPSVAFSRSGGSFVNTFNLALSTTSSNAVIRFTTDTSAPTTSSPIYTTPIAISSTIQIRARAFETNLLPGEIRTETFVQLDSAVSIVNFTSDLPIMILHTLTGGGVGGGDQAVAVQVFEPKNGRSSMTNPADFSEHGIFHLRGSSTYGYQKGSFFMEIQDEFGRDKDVSVISNLPADSDWVLYAPNNFEPVLVHNPVAHDLQRQAGHYGSRTRFVEVYLKDDGGVPGKVVSGDYNGIYVLEEKPKIGKDRVNIDKVQAENLTAPSVTGGYLLGIDRLPPGENSFNGAGNNVNYIDPKYAEITLPERDAQEQYIINYFTAFGNALNGASYTNPVTGYAAYVDVDSWIDHHIHEIVTFNVDCLRLSTYLYKPRDGKISFGPSWDYDRTQGSTDGRDINPAVWDSQNYFFTYPWWGRMFQDPDFWQKWIDRFQNLRFDTKAYSTTNVAATIEKYASQVRAAQPRELARWGVGMRSGGGGFDGTYNGEVQFMKNWYSNRLAFIDGQFEGRPSLSSPGGNITSGFQLNISAPVGATIYYTVDGSDPRAPGGGISAAARIYSGILTLTNNVRIVARSRDLNHQNQTGGNAPVISSPWSGPVAATFVERIPPLVITEIMYHPSAAPPVGNTNDPGIYEYVELKNIGTNALNVFHFKLSGGIDFEFPNLTLAAGQRVIVAANTNAFTSRYGAGILIAGQYTGSLNNSGDHLVLQGAILEPILDFNYNNSWYPVTDGLGFSLVVVNENAPLSNWGDQSNWRASTGEIGSPGTGDLAAPAFPTVLVNEVLANGALPQVDAIELFNSSTNLADISGWFLSDSVNTPKKYRIPPGTVMAPGSFLVFYETNSFGATNAYTANGTNAFGLGASGDDIYLFSGNGTNLTGYAHGFSFNASPTNVTYGRFEISTGPDIFVLQLSNTLGGPNSGPFIGPIAGPIVINEFTYDPASPNTSFIELFNTSSNLTFDLSYWQINGLSYTFPPGSMIGPRAYLVLAADRSSFAAEYGAGISVFGTFSGSFATDGETITLIQPGPTKAQDVIVDRVHYDNALPWSTNANGTGFGFQLIDPLQDNSRVGNWASSYYPGSYTPATNLPGMLVPGFTNYNLRFASVSGNIGNPSRLLLYLGEVGDVYIDDLYLASGNVAEAGTNLIVNGDFETPLLGAPLLTNFFTSVGSYHANSVIATTNAHSGNNSLRIVSTNNSSFALTRVLYKDVPGVTNGQPCTLSFWYRPTFGATNLYARFQSSTIGSSSIPTAVLTPPSAVTSNMPPTFVPAITILPASIRTPGAANTNAATLPAFPPLWLNEVQAENLTGPTNSAGQHTPWLELYNAGPNVITLTNLFLTGNYTNLTSWAFPAGATINPGEFKLIFADGQTGLSTLSELHTSFTLPPGSGSLALSRLYNGQPQVIDYVNYTAASDHSYGSFLNGQSFDRQEFLIVTPRAANVTGLNTAPVLAAIASTNINEGVLYSFTAIANDTDLPAQTLTFTLAGQPTGASITTGGLFTWTPTEAQGPGVYNLSVIVADNGNPSLTHTQSFTLTVNEVNTAPVLTPIASTNVNEGFLLAFTATANDTDVPAQTLTFSLSGQPPGASITTGGLFTWTPAANQAPGTNTIAVIVADNGAPSLSATQTFTVVVIPPPRQLTISRTNDTQVTLTWQSFPGRNYRVEYLETVDAPANTWTPIGDPLTATGDTLTFTDTIAPNAQRFYRVRQLQP